MEKFMLIFQGGIKSDSSPEELQADMGKWMAWVEKLHKENCLLLSNNCCNKN